MHDGEALLLRGGYGRRRWRSEGISRQGEQWRARLQFYRRGRVDQRQTARQQTHPGSIAEAPRGKRTRVEDRRNPAREHAFARTRRSDHQNIVSARHRDLDRAFRKRLAFDFGKIDSGKTLSIPGTLASAVLKSGPSLKTLPVSSSSETSLARNPSESITEFSIGAPL